MNFNCRNIGREEESLKIANINLLNWFNKAGEIFPSVTQVLSILLTTAATSANIERVNSKERVANYKAVVLQAAIKDRDNQTQVMKHKYVQWYKV